MSFTKLLPYFRESLKLHEATKPLKEWRDAFNVDNIPSTRLDNGYHLEILPASYTGTAHTGLGYRAQVRLRAFWKGYEDPADAVDKAVEYADSITKACCKSTRRLNQPRIKNILPISVDIRPLATSNDNVALVDMTFECTLMVDPDEI